MKTFQQLQADNKRLMVELSNLNLSTPEGKARREAIRAEMDANNRDKEAIAKSLGGQEQMPRMFKYRRNHAQR